MRHDGISDVRGTDRLPGPTSRCEGNGAGVMSAGAERGERERHGREGSRSRPGTAGEKGEGTGERDRDPDHRVICR
jgi:hypothetical protein